MKNKNRAFSLIELSIVILIIGILIAGVTQGSRLVGASRIQTAQTSTESSPVAGLRGLVLWLETSKPESFIESEAEDETNLSTWYDTNPQVPIPKTFTVTASEDITYETSGINGLPTVEFDGTQTATLDGENGTEFIVTPYAAYTIFIVSRVESISSSTDTLLFNGTDGTNGFGINHANGVTVLNDGAGTFTSVTGTDVATANAGQITTVTIAPDSVRGIADATPAVFFYIDGQLDTTDEDDLDANMVTPTGNFYIGLNDGGTETPLQGEISEIIVFDHVLKEADREAIENYLGQKYAITVSHS